MSDEERKALYDSFSNHASFCRQSLVVETEAKTVVPMVLSTGQQRLRDAIKRQRESNRPVRIIFLKSRRIMATTGTAAEFFHDTAFRAGVHTAVIAHDAKSVEYIFGMYKRFNERYKPFAGLIKLPPNKPLSDRIDYEYGGETESSWIRIHTAGNLDFGRGTRLTNVHFSEFPYYMKPADTLAAVMSAVPKLPDTCAVIEGTAKTIGDLFHKMWAASLDQSSDSEWIGLFMGWWEHPSNRMPLVSLERFANSVTKDERELQQRFNLDMEQLAWRRFTIANDFIGDVMKFQREHPATPEEAFTAASRNRFSVPHINRMAIEREPMIGELELEQVGVEKRIVFLPNARGAMRVFRRPEKGKLYAIGADCAQGEDVGEGSSSDPDFSAAQVFDRDTGEQCAIMHARMMPGETGRYIAALGRWYNMAQICGERNPGGGGISMLEAIINSDYPSGLLYHRSLRPDQDPQVRGDRLGWDTSGVSRPRLLSKLDEAIRLSAIHVHCALTQGELLTFVFKPNGKPGAQSGCHDDLVIALALVIVVCEEMPRPIRTSAQAPRPEISRYGQTPDREARGTIMRVRR